jgi:hypothetical protein
MLTPPLCRSLQDFPGIIWGDTAIAVHVGDEAFGLQFHIHSQGMQGICLVKFPVAIRIS